ncbi:MAG TPA: hypothetical protein VG838_03480 [Opitutaceae bacterium]|nr:hypothetical protein [Opitutaceae bacterium]
MNVLIVYEDATAARRAVRVVSRLAAEAAGLVNFRRSFWRFDLLDNRDCRAAATRDGLQADVIIVVTRTAEELPSVVNRWLEDCLRRRHQAGTAVLALLGSGNAWSISLEDETGFHAVHHPSEPAAPAFATEDRSLLLVGA